MKFYDEVDDTFRTQAYNAIGTVFDSAPSDLSDPELVTQVCLCVGMCVYVYACVGVLSFRYSCK